jgi:hypothetical protein
MHRGGASLVGALKAGDHISSSFSFLVVENTSTDSRTSRRRKDEDEPYPNRRYTRR